MRKSWIIAQKEWAEVFKNRFVLFTVAFMPLMLTAIPLLVLYFMRSSEGASGITTGDLPPSFAALCKGMSGEACGQYFLVTEFMLLFLLMPLAIPVTIASYSIVGEKTTRTLEPLLATPTTTFQLLVGKALAALLPAIAATWACFSIFVLGARLMAISPQTIARLLDPLWLMAILVVAPLLALAAVSVAVMISSRVNDPRVAEQLSMMVVLPVLLLFFGQIAGLVLISEQLILWMAVALAAIDVGLLAFALHLFQRETILTRWK